MKKFILFLKGLILKIVLHKDFKTHFLLYFYLFILFGCCQLILQFLPQLPSYQERELYYILDLGGPMVIIFSCSIILIKKLLNIHKDNWDLILKHSSLLFILFFSFKVLRCFAKNPQMLEQLFGFLTIFAFVFIYFTRTKKTLEMSKVSYNIKLFIVLPILTFFFNYAVHKIFFSP